MKKKIYKELLGVCRGAIEHKALLEEVIRPLNVELAEIENKLKSLEAVKKYYNWDIEEKKLLELYSSQMYSG